MSDQKQSPHIKDLSIRNFKCFDEIQLTDFRLFNIITGDNNIGKTSLLESLLFYLNNDLKILLRRMIGLMYRKDNITSYMTANSMENYYYSLNQLVNFYGIRKEGTIFNVNYLNGSSNKKSINIRNSNNLSPIELTFINERYPNSTFITDSIISETDGKLSDIIFDKDIYTAINSVSERYEPYISTNLAYAVDLVNFFSDNFVSNKAHYFDLMSALKNFILDIESITITTSHIPNNKPSIGVKTTTGFYSLSSFGEGSIKMFRIVTEIAKCKNSILLIDEIDTGIYYKKFKEYWKAILKIAKENNVQLFVTTHSKECLDYLVEAMEELGGDYQKELRYINMYRNKENRVMSSTYNYEEFKSDINIGNEVR